MMHAFKLHALRCELIVARLRGNRDWIAAVVREIDMLEQGQ